MTNLKLLVEPSKDVFDDPPEIVIELLGVTQLSNFVRGVAATASE